jgi:peptidoglycan/LPS O-acetylase OafA/YrhL
MRINALDYLRGLMALCIMVYHYFSWTFHEYDSTTFLGVFGIYGVSIFYILSGLTLYHVYNNKLDFSNLYSFFVKRIFRILPLLWLSIFLNIFLLGQTYDLRTIFLNASGLFGFFDHDNYITAGAWSIGNELVFYSLFPMIIILNRWKHYWTEIFFILSLIIAIYFAFWGLNSSENLSHQWTIYINPMNQIFLFTGGMLIGKIIGMKKSNIASLLLFIVCLLFIIFYPNSGDQINLVSGWNRIIYSFISFVLTISFLLIDTIIINKIVDWGLTKLGHISYSLYLLHAIVFWTVAKFINRVESQTLFLTICFISTIVTSYLSYNFLEMKFSKLGKRLLTKPKLH